MESWLREEELEWTWAARPRGRSAVRVGRRRSPRAALVAGAGAAVVAAAVLGGLALRPAAPPVAAARMPAGLGALVGSLDHQHRLLAALSHCESRDQPGVVSPDGRYGGLFQFDQRTWAAVGGHGSPAAASPYEQRLRAQRLLQWRGLAPWPRCGPIAAARASG